MNIITKIFIVVLIVIPFSCGSGNQTNEKENEATAAPASVESKVEEKPFAHIQFASNIDTSCRMPLSAGIEDTLHLDDKIYGFCSKECKDEFVNKLKAEEKR